MLLLALSMFLQAAVAAQPVIVRTFDDDKVGAPPVGFAMAAGREAASDGWTVKREGSARVLVHEGKQSPPDSFAVAILSAPQYQDVRCPCVSRRSAADAAGLVWKYQDPMNHCWPARSCQTGLAVPRRQQEQNPSSERTTSSRSDAWHALNLSGKRPNPRVLGGIRVLSERDRLPRVSANVGIWAGGLDGDVRRLPRRDGS
jgi:hypothetical protein